MTLSVVQDDRSAFIRAEVREITIGRDFDGFTVDVLKGWSAEINGEEIT